MAKELFWWSYIIQLHKKSEGSKVKFLKWSWSPNDHCKIQGLPWNTFLTTITKTALKDFIWEMGTFMLQSFFISEEIHKCFCQPPAPLWVDNAMGLKGWVTIKKTLLWKEKEKKGTDIFTRTVHHNSNEEFYEVFYGVLWTRCLCGSKRNWYIVVMSTTISQEWCRIGATLRL